MGASLDLVFLSPSTCRGVAINSQSLSLLRRVDVKRLNIYLTLFIDKLGGPCILVQGLLKMLIHPFGTLRSGLTCIDPQTAGLIL